jgi:hypothetical protein
MLGRGISFFPLRPIFRHSSMTMNYRLAAVEAVLLVTLVTGYTTAADKKGEKQMTEQEIMNVMKKLDQLDERSRMRLLSQVDAQRNELLGVLLKHLGTSPSENVQAAAIYLIGRHRLADGVSQLIRRIDFVAESLSDEGPEPLWEKYPAMEALITIGLPSVPAAVELLATDANDLRRNLAVKVIRYIEGAEIAKFILERSHAAENSPDRRSKLEDALLRLNRLIQETELQE